jgi:hypothetical protein
MGKRVLKRAQVTLSLRIYGLDSAGRPFSELARTLDVTAWGARLAGVCRELVPGDVIGIRVGANKGRFRVIWVGTPATDNARHVGVEGLEATKNVWGVDIPRCADGGHEPPARRIVDRRRHSRQTCLGGVRVCTAANRSFWAELTDVSMDGCYISTSFSLSRGTAVNLQLNIASMQIEIRGVARACHPGVGIGVEFIRTRDVNEQLRSLLRSLGQRATSRKPAHTLKGA